MQKQHKFTGGLFGVFQNKIRQFFGIVQTVGMMTVKLMIYHSQISARSLKIFGKNIKVGLAVTKKVGHAVVRNKIRRRLREIIKKQVPNLKQNNNIIVVARDNISSASFEKLSNEFLKLIKKADLINEESI